jgi:hypothetical protein
VGILCVLPKSKGEDVTPEVWQSALEFCVKYRAFLLVDPPLGWRSAESVRTEDVGLTGDATRNASIYFPRLIEDGDSVLPSGTVAGVIARTDAQVGIWKAPAGRNAVLAGVQGLQLDVTDAQNHVLNQLGVNCLRAFPSPGIVIWGSRTLRAGGNRADEYAYVPVRRFALYIEESIGRGLHWAVFEPNGDALWTRIRDDASAFMLDLFRRGALQGKRAEEAYFVKCDRQTMTSDDIDAGNVKVVVGFAPLRPSEFVNIHITVKADSVHP